jgi:hypothetical protein
MTVIATVPAPESVGGVYELRQGAEYLVPFEWWHIAPDGGITYRASFPTKQSAIAYADRL